MCHLINTHAQRLQSVLCAAMNDIFSGWRTIFVGSRIRYDKTPQERLELLLGLTIACVQHELWQLFYRGNPDVLKSVFTEMAKEWKKFFEPGKNVEVYNMSDGVREFAQDYCKALQNMLRNNKDRPGEKYNFNYIRIPRPGRSKALMEKKRKAAVDNNNEDNKMEKSSSSDCGNATKKQK